MENLAQQTPLFRDLKTVHEQFIRDEFPQQKQPKQESFITYHYRYRTTAAQYKLALALLLYRTEHGVFPERLTALVPAILPRLPVTAFTGQPFSYRRTADGFELTGNDGVDGPGAKPQFVLTYHTWTGAAGEVKND